MTLLSIGLKTSQLEPFVDNSQNETYTFARMDSYQILRNFVVVSILLHLIFGYSAIRFAPFVPARKVSVVDLVENEPQKQNPKSEQSLPFVRQATPPKTVAEKKPAHFFSEKDQSVMEERRAAVSGMTENRSGNPMQQQQRIAEEEEKRKKPDNPGKKITTAELSKIKPEETKLYGDMNIKKFEKESEKEPPHPENESKPMIFPQVGGYGMQRGSSTVGEKLPQDIQIGDFTALNTDRFTYYTFFARMEEVFRPKWINYVKAAVYTYEQTHRRAREEEFVTTIELLLDKDGNFVKGILHQGSGFEALDLAPVRAFRDSAKFPNPPQEMVKDDNYIHLDYQFTVHFMPQYLGTGQ